MNNDNDKKVNVPEINGQEKYVLQLYVNGGKPSSARAIKNTLKFCEDYLHEEYRLQVIDLNEHPILAIKQDIVATPTLVIKKLPDSLQKLIGDLSNIDHVLLGYNLKKL